MMRRSALALLVCACTSGPNIIGGTAETGGGTTTFASADDGPQPAETTSGAQDDGVSGQDPPGGTSSGSSDDAPDTTGELGPLELQLCPEIAAESVYCLVVTGFPSGARVVGVDTGDACTIADTESLSVVPVSIAWIDDAIVMSLDSDEIARVDLVTDEVEVVQLDTYVVVVTSIEDEFLVVPFAPEPMRRYATYADIVAGNVAAELPNQLSGTTLSIADGVIHAAAYSSNVVERASVSPPYDLLPSITLQGHDETVNGISVVGDRLFVNDGMDRIREFDAATGEHVRDIDIAPDLVFGLSCRPGL
jgi:hypothetical protein